MNQKWTKNAIINTIRTSQTKAKWKFNKHLKTLKNWYIIIFLIKYFYLADLRDLKQSLKTFKTRKTGFTSYNFSVCGPYNLPCLQFLGHFGIFQIIINNQTIIDGDENFNFCFEESLLYDITNIKNNEGTEY